MIVYLDLDRTLFKTSEIGAVWEYIGQLYPEAKDAFDNHEAYFHYVGDYYYYDMGAHLTSLGLDPAGAYASVAASEYADGRFEMEGCKALVDSLMAEGYDVKVLTFGSDDYQRFKASLCPSLREVPIITTLRPKPEVLEEFAEECWLVDDRPLGDELSGNVSFIQLSEDGVAVPHDADWTVKRSLNEVREFFHAILH